MKVFTWILRIVLILLLVSPILGSFGIFPEPTPEMYNTPEAFTFINVLMHTGYITQIMSVVFAIAAALTLTNRMAAAALLLLPITVNIVGFHLILDDGLFTAGAIMANLLALINLFFLWKNRAVYRGLLVKSA